MISDLVRSLVARVATVGVKADPLSVAIAAVGGLVVALFVVPNLPTKHGIPGPFRLPIAGNALALAKYANTGKSHELFHQYFTKYGAVFSLSAFGVLILAVRDPVLIHRALTDTTSFRRSERAGQRVPDIIGEALFVLPSGEQWKRHRKQLQPAFAPLQLRNAATVIDPVVGKLADYFTDLAAKHDGSATVNIYSEFTALTFDLIGVIGFSFNLDAIKSLHEGTANESFEILEDVPIIFQQRVFRPPSTWEHHGIGLKSPRPLRVRKFLDDLFGRVIEERHAANSRAREPKDPKTMDVLDRLLLGSEELGTFTKNEVIGEMAAFFLAGHETTANTLTLLMMELSRNPEIQERLYTENKTTLASLKEGLTAENLHEFKYLDFVVKESQRLHAVVGRVGRQTTRDIDYNGRIIPAGTNLMLAFNEAHRDPKYWPAPERFNPDRWDGLKPHPGSFVPFGDGPMNCIGQKLALIEIKMTIIRLIERFRIALVPGQDLSYVTTITTGLKHGLRVALTPRI
ncbi:hypothetical protein HK105_206074 [Polyrhizophydium stewartii]|uniref:Cytochrome P450 n=1 Tax=Polyrhizophydium stewartii TaxID=2732419 RepID=A0ABR4N4R3_9FUNG